MYGVTPEERTWAILAHLSAIIASFISLGWLSFVGPLLIWLFKRDSSPFVRAAATQSFNFNVALTIVNIIGWICFFTVLLIPLSLLIWLVAWILMLVHHIRATIAANRYELYRYPFQLHILN